MGKRYCREREAASVCGDREECTRAPSKSNSNGRRAATQNCLARALSHLVDFGAKALDACGAAHVDLANGVAGANSHARVREVPDARALVGHQQHRLRAHAKGNGRLQARTQTTNKAEKSEIKYTRVAAFTVGASGRTMPVLRRGVAATAPLCTAARPHAELLPLLPPVSGEATAMDE